MVLEGGWPIGSQRLEEHLTLTASILAGTPNFFELTARLLAKVYRFSKQFHARRKGEFHLANRLLTLDV